MQQPKVLLFFVLLCMIILSSCTKDNLDSPNGPEGTAVSSQGFSFDGKVLSILKGSTVSLSDEKLTAALSKGLTLSKGSSGEKSINIDELSIDGNLVICEKVSIITKKLNLKGRIRSSQSLHINTDVTTGGGIIDLSASAAPKNLSLFKQSSYFKTLSSENPETWPMNGGDGQTGAGGDAGPSGEFAGNNNNTNGGNGKNAGNANPATGNGSDGGDGGNLSGDLGYIDHDIRVLTYGGKGGNGGNGGNGGQGGSSDFYIYQQKYINPHLYWDYWMTNCYWSANWQEIIPVPAKNGGNGGNGGHGGNAGISGWINVSFQRTSPGHIIPDTHGASGGNGGNGGSPGPGGVGTAIIIVEKFHYCSDCDHWQTTNLGTLPNGSNGLPGTSGGGGTSASAGNVTYNPY